ncbi:MAG: hypothetical protein ACP5ID_03500, partial [Conexivisphaera sp.]
VELVSYRAVETMGEGARAAVERAVGALERDFGWGNVGLIAIGGDGPAVGLSARLMPVAGASIAGSASALAGEVPAEEVTRRLRSLLRASGGR